MKIKTALKQSKAAVKFDSVLVLIALVLVLTWPNGYTIAFIAISSLYLFMEVYNVIHITRKAAKDPAFLEEKIK